MRARWVVLVASALLGCGPSVPPNIILITVDTLRADHLALHGYPRSTSPNLDRFARESTWYKRARTTAPWTLPAHASLFTGLYPIEHGAQMIDRRQGVSPKNQLPLRQDVTTLAEVLGDAGYHTMGVCANFMYLDPRYGLDQGFDDWLVLAGQPNVVTAEAPEVNRRARRWLQRRNPGPFFLFLNYMDTHVPYNTNPRPEFLPHDVPLFDLSHWKRLEHAVHTAKVPLPARAMQTLVDQYDLAIANLDAGLGELFESLRSMALYDDALIIVTADHGEYLGEHRLLGHSKDLYEPAMWIPLIVKAPRQRRGREVDPLISLIHIPELVLSLAGFEGLAATSRFPRHEDGGAILGQNKYSLWVDLKQPWGLRFARRREVLYRGSHKYIHSSDGQHELFDFENDPEERVNLLTASGTRQREWSSALSALRPAPPAKLPEPLPSLEQSVSEPERERLRAIGYVD